MNVLVTGSTGFVGWRVVSQLLGAGHVPVGVLREAASERQGAASITMDLTEPGCAHTLLEGAQPDAVVNLAAVADIESCVVDPDRARRLNKQWPAELAAACEALGIRLVHVSTDQVFDGTHGAWTETDVVCPLHAYGATKAAGECAVLANSPTAAIVRPGLVTGEAHAGRRSATTQLLGALEVAKAGGDGPVMFTDEIRSPIAVEDLARVLVDVCENDSLSGLFHAGGSEVLTRHALAVREAQQHGFDEGLIRSGLRRSSNLADIRPADLSLDSGRLVAGLGWIPRAVVL